MRFTSYSNGPAASRQVVQVEQQRPLRRGERAEVRQVSVAAELGIQPGHRGLAEVGRHDRGRAPVEGEWRDHHPAVPDRDQVRLPGPVLLLDQGDRVGPVARGRPPRVLLPGGVWALAILP